MYTTTLSLENIHANGALFADLMRARQDAVARGADEFDQYDTPASRWVTVHENGRILAGVRLTPTTHRCGVFSYRARDAQRGLVQGLPSDLMDGEAPVADHVWECGRLFIDADLSPARRLRIGRALMVALARSARDLGASMLIGIVPTFLVKRLRHGGMDCAPAGAAFDAAGAQAVCVTASLQSKMH